MTERYHDSGSQGNSAESQGEQPLLLDVKGVSWITSLSERSIWRGVDVGRVPKPLKVGGRRLWRRSDIERWVAAGCPEQQ